MSQPLYISDAAYQTRRAWYISNWRDEAMHACVLRFSECVYIHYIHFESIVAYGNGPLRFLAGLAQKDMLLAVEKVDFDTSVQHLLRLLNHSTL